MGFPIPFPGSLWDVGTGIGWSPGLPSGPRLGGEEQASVGFQDATSGEESSDCLAQCGVADVTDDAELAAGHGSRGVAEGLLDSLLGRRSGGSRGRIGGGGGRMEAQGQRVVVLAELKGEGGDGGGGSVLDDELKAPAVTYEEIGIGPRPDLGRAAEPQTRIAAAVFPGVVD